ncbi:MAG: hypothetical protein P1U58_03440 [Verrucomicrobiales bacterium]|nr:hypothetical protein [Verrucomicrobiales bacterium]
MEWHQSLAQFSDRLSPVFVRDLRQVLRSPLIVAAFLVLQVTILSITGLELALLKLTDGTFAASFLNTALTAFLSLGFGFALPLTALGALQPELGSGRNIELLLSASLSRWKVVRGKWFTMTTMSFLLLISITPYLTVRYFLGSIDLIMAVEVFLSALIANAVMNAIVIGASGFNSYIARAGAILFLGVIFSICATLNVAVTSSASSIQQLSQHTLGTSLAGAVIIILSLQIGRAHLKLFSTLEKPSSMGGIFVMAFVFPLFQGLGRAFGGSIAPLIISLLWLALAFLIDRSHRPSYRYRVSSSPT